MEITWLVIGVGVAVALVAYVKLNFGGMKKEDFLKLYQQEGGEIIDVRTASEYSSGHYKNSKNLDFNSGQFEKSISKLDPSKNYFLYCRSGARSSAATRMLQSKGFKKVHNLGAYGSF